MNFYSKNLDYIEKYKSYLNEKFKNYDKANLKPMLDSIQSIETKDKNQSLLINYKEKPYRLNSIYRPINEAERWAEQFKFMDLDIVVSMFGFGNGIFVREIIKKLNKGDLLIIYEPCIEIFLHVLENYDISDILKNKQVSIAIDGLNSFEFHNLLMVAVKITNLKTQKYILHPHYDEIFPYQYRDFLIELKDNNEQAVVNVNTRVNLGDKMIYNSLKNIRHIMDSNALLEFYDDIPKDIPAIIIAAGPSLKKNIQYLKLAKGKSVIFVVDRALDYVLDYGIEPDFVVTLDPEKPLDYFSKKDNISIPMISVLEATPEIFDFHNGRKIISDCIQYFREIYKKLNKKVPQLITGVSVATETFFACKELGFKKIILVGQDLAYDGQDSHAGGIKEEVLLSADKIIVDGNNGSKVQSRYDWYRMIIWYQDMIEIFPDIQVINATEGGALIKGTTIMPLKEAIDNYCITEFNCEQIVREKESTFSKSELKEFTNELKQGAKELIIIEKKSKEAIKICKKLLKECNSNSTTSYVEQDGLTHLAKINKTITDMTINSLIDFYVTAHATDDITNIYQFSEEEQKNKTNTYSKAQKVYETTMEAVKYTKPLLDDTIEYFETNFCND